MKPILTLLVLGSGLALSSGCTRESPMPLTAAGQPEEGALAPFLGSARFAVDKLTQKPGNPNVVVAVDGTVIVCWGKQGLPYVFRSEDGGATWSGEIPVGDNPEHGGRTVGAAVVDETTGDIIVFLHGSGPERQWVVGHTWRSRDHGKTWQYNGATLDIVASNTAAPIAGKTSIPGPGMTMGCDSGITLRHGKHRGRLLIPARNWSRPGHPVAWEERYSCAIYSDDGGRTWHTSAPFPAYGTGEGALEELSDGRIQFNSRRHWENPRRKRWIAWSHDGGATWGELEESEELPDGHRSGSGDPGLMGGLVRLPVRDRDILLFSNVDSEEGRNHGTVWASFDGGRTWPIKRLVEEGGFGYSSMTAGRPGTPSEGSIYLLYQGGGPKIARFNLAWVLGGTFTGNGALPDWVKLGGG